MLLLLVLVSILCSRWVCGGEYASLPSAAGFSQPTGTGAQLAAPWSGDGTGETWSHMGQDICLGYVLGHDGEMTSIIHWLSFTFENVLGKVFYADLATKCLQDWQKIVPHNIWLNIQCVPPVFCFHPAENSSNKHSSQRRSAPGFYWRHSLCPGRLAHSSACKSRCRWRVSFSKETKQVFSFLFLCAC